MLLEFLLLSTVNLIIKINKILTEETFKTLFMNAIGVFL